MIVTSGFKFNCFSKRNLIDKRYTFLLPDGFQVKGFSVIFFLELRMRAACHFIPRGAVNESGCKVFSVLPINLYFPFRVTLGCMDWSNRVVVVNRLRKRCSILNQKDLDLLHSFLISQPIQP